MRRRSSAVTLPFRECSEAASAADVEHPLGGGNIRQGQRRGPVGDLVVQSTAPASFIAGCSLFEGHHVSIGMHRQESDAGV